MNNNVFDEDEGTEAFLGQRLVSSLGCRADIGGFAVPISNQLTME